MMNKKIENKLINLLRNIYDDDDFIFGILVYADTDSLREKVINFIENGCDVDMETITVYAIELNH